MKATQDTASPSASFNRGVPGASNGASFNSRNPDCGPATGQCVNLGQQQDGHKDENGNSSAVVHSHPPVGSTPSVSFAPMKGDRKNSNSPKWVLASPGGAAGAALSSGGAGAPAPAQFALPAPLCPTPQQQGGSGEMDIGRIAEAMESIRRGHEILGAELTKLATTHTGTEG
eukprot:317606-Prymnesium_polylepis.1